MSSKLEPIAIISMACHFPGNATSPEDFWQMLCAGTDAVTFLPNDRFAVDRFCSATPQEGHSYVQAAGVIPRVKDFDPEFFGISHKEARSLDPQQRLMLEITWEALERAHIVPSSLRGANVGVYVGASNMDNSMQSSDDPCVTSQYSMTGSSLSIIANRLSYFFDLHGPSMTIDTACSSSLVAVHQACEALRHGSLNMAMAGGVNVLLAPYPFIGFSQTRMLSPDGRCKAFDASGNGYVRSEGAGILLLKRLSQAKADGDAILGIIAGSGVNSDGRTTGIALPNKEAQQALLESVYTSFALDKTKVVYVEAHGTGTAAGDPLEASAIGNVLGKAVQGKRVLPVGSVKTNIGHLEPASGMAGLIKSLLVLQHGKIPPTLHLTTPNPAIDFQGLNITVPTSTATLPEDGGGELVSINSFGFGGANAHVVLQKAALPVAASAPEASGVALPPFLLSAKSQASLQALASRYAEICEEASPEDIYATAATLAMHREAMPVRACITAENRAELTAQLKKTAKSSAETAHVFRGVSCQRGGVFAFSGNGSQWCGMGTALMRENAVFRSTVEKVDALLSPMQGWSLCSILADPQRFPDAFDLTEQSQPLLFAVQVGLVEALKAKGVVPGATLGHSVGEVAAAWAAGALSLEDAATVIHFRSLYQGRLLGAGSMAVAGLSQKEAEVLLAPFNGAVEIAAINTMNSLTLAGETKALKAVVDLCKQRRIVAKMLGLAYPFHTKAMEAVRNELMESLAHITPQKSKIPFFSTVTGDASRKNLCNNEYWWQNIRQPVLFCGAVQRAYAKGFRFFMEVGPAPILRSYMTELLHAQPEPTCVRTTLHKNKAGQQELDAAWKGAWLEGWKLHLPTLFPVPFQKQTLPTYPWNREYFWVEDTPENRGFMKAPRLHPLLGWQLPAASSVFENTLHLTDYPWLADHKAGNSTPYPAAAFLESMLAAAAHLFPGERQELERVTLFRPLHLVQDKAKLVKISVDKEDGGVLVEARTHMRTEDWGVYAKGRILAEPVSPPVPTQLFGAPEDFGVPIDQSTLYKTAARYLLHYGPAFQTVKRAWIQTENEHPEVLAELAEPVAGSGAGMLVPPTLVDGAFQTLFILLGAQGSMAARAYLPAAFERVVLHSQGVPKRVHARLERISPRSVVASFTLLDQEGKVLMSLSRCRFRRAPWLEHEVTPSQGYSVRLEAIPHPHGVEALAGGTASALLGVIAKQTRDAENGPARQGIPAQTLLQLTSLAMAHETVLTLCNKANATPTLHLANLQEEGMLAPAQEAWVYALLEYLERAGLAARQNECWVLQTNTGKPSATALWRTLVSSAPEFVHEAALLAHVFTARGALLSERKDSNEHAALPTRLVNNYFSHASSLRRATQVTRNLVRCVLQQGSAGQRVQVLHKEGYASGIFEHIAPHVSQAGCRYVVAERDAATAEASSLRFGASGNIAFEPVDLENPPSAHHGQYHLIVLANTLHTTLNTAAALAGCRAMLAPGGVLAICEHTPSLFADYVFGASPEWWAASTVSSQPVSLLQNTAFWQEQLAVSGFTALCPEGDDGNDHTLFVLAQSNTPHVHSPLVPLVEEQQEPQQEEAPQSHWVLVAPSHGAAACALAQRTHAALVDAGHAASILAPSPAELHTTSWWHSLLQQEKKGAPLHVLFLAGYDTRTDIDGATLEAIQHTGVCALTALVQAWEKERSALHLWVLAGGALADGMPGASPVPSQGALAGFFRVLVNEQRNLPAHFIDLHDAEENREANLPALVRELTEPDAEPEIVLCQGKRFVPRLVQRTGATSFPHKNTSREGATLVFDAPGRLQNLYWRTMPVPQPKKHEVCIKVHHSGLNFRDVMWAMGLLLDEALENGFSGPTMGLECSGIVQAVGEGVTQWKPGDEVVCFAPACLSSHVVTRETALAKKPASLSFAEAATLPVPFITAWYSLKHLANMQPGEKVLIHGAAGGVGLAAIQIAAHLGLEVHATAGSAEKHHFLRQLGVRHLYSSRNLHFARQVMEATDGTGVDVVLNSLAGEAISAGLATLKPFGRFIELGKRDFYADTPLRLRPFADNLTYFGVDVDQLLVFQPALAQKLFAELMELFQQRKLIPLPHTVYNAAIAVEAFQAMQQASHIGKLVISLEKVASVVRPPQEELQRVQLSPDATYLVTGGVNGLGLATAKRLARRGARHLLLVSRSAQPDQVSALTIESLRAQGVQVVLGKADVANEQKLAACLKKHLREMPPLRGVIHAAAVLDDGIISSLNPERLANSLAAKAMGAWNLHTHTRHIPLDFFVLYSSATTAFGNPGQAGYVAANCMLETLAAWRRTQKLPAVVVGWGPIGDTGMLTRNAKAQEMLLKVLGISPTSSTDAMNWLEHCIATERGDSHFLGIDWHNRAELPALAAPRFVHVRPRQATKEGGEGPSLEQLRACPPKEATRIITQILVDELSHILRMPKDRIGAEVPLVSLGMDSLMAVELALAVEQKFELTGYTLPLSEKTTPATLAESLYAAVCGDGAEEDAATTMLDSLESKHSLQLSSEERKEVIRSMQGEARG